MTLTATASSTVTESRQAAERRLRQLSAKGREIRLEVQEAGRKAWLAGLGAVAITGEQGKELFSTLVERGGERRRASRTAVEKRLAELRERLRAAGTRVEDRVEQGTAAALRRFGIPSRDEVITLSERIAQLSKKVESLAGRA